ncbi:hypothetical protein [Desulfovibrio sp. JC022]|uniref:hypothetical protein n=1 Tax=Desulfovibrio sp. JC022 TaxID=2593642 RepID=UPI0013CFF04F|nr:hypothetical protein [Desulfovibrio sp. JC022]NDV23152.1 hypothetical protein [Desulfovibrio sp. JC022]
MKKMTRQAVFRKLDALYGRMASVYADTSARIGLSCEGCEENCCTSYFQHHTYVEWTYLWQGLNQLPEDKRNEYIRRSEDYVRNAKAMLDNGMRPKIMCPLNDDGLCGVYKHRLMICRMHGVVNTLRQPNGRQLSFPGCFKCQELTEGMDNVPVVDRTPLYKELVGLEMGLLGNKIRTLPKVDLTLAEMIVMGPPNLNG